MKSKIKRIILPLLIVPFFLSGCSKHYTCYHATNFVTKSTSAAAALGFDTFRGIKTYRLIPDNNVYKLFWTGYIDEGEAYLFMDNGEGKVPLCTLKAGEGVTDSIYIYNNRPLYLSFESLEEVKEGYASFSIGIILPEVDTPVE